MHVCAAAIVLLLSSSACAAGSSAPPGADCATLADHVARVRIEARLEAIPEAERDAHRAPLIDGVSPALRAACDRMTATERTCWRDAASIDELGRCVQPSPDDAAALANAGRMPYAGAPAPTNSELSRQEP